MLTGLLIFIYAGSHTQITVGLFLAVISMRILSMANPYVEDIDDSLANMGQLQIVLVFIASLVLHAKDMPEQEGAPGNIFKGPLFAFVMVLIGTMTLLMTFYMIVSEYCGIESPKDAQDAASSVASASSASSVAFGTFVSEKRLRPRENRRRLDATLLAASCASFGLSIPQYSATSM